MTYSGKIFLGICWVLFILDFVKTGNMNLPEHFNENLSFRERILYVLRKLHKASADEVAMEIMELQGISTEDGVADLTEDTKEELSKLNNEGIVTKVKDHRQKLRYSLMVENDPVSGSAINNSQK
jgi:hypothetical protein